MESSSFDMAIVGGGIIGLATGMRLVEAYPGIRAVVIEKEDRIAAHQTGHNSGVIHSGLYYRPNSLKARLCVSGSRELVSFCREHVVSHEICGKIVAATSEDQLAALDELYRRGNENQVPGLRMLDPAEVREFEPHVRCIRGLLAPGTGIVDYTDVAKAYAKVFEGAGGKIWLGRKVVRIITESGGLRIETTRGKIFSRSLINCAGLYSDRVARIAGFTPPCAIIPFRGEYYRIKPERGYLVNNLIYPVPDPAFPFLGVHLTRTIDGKIEAGPNAVLAFAREGYSRARVDPAELIEIVCYPGFRRMVSRYWKKGVAEMVRSFSKKLFAKGLRELIPEVCEEDLIPGGAGVRAQAVGPDGRLLDDFVVQRDERMVHVLNAPSPAATSSAAIAAHIVENAAGILS